VSAPVIEVLETDESQTVDVPLRVRGAVRERVVLWVQLSGPRGARGQRVVIEPGDPAPVFQVEVQGDDVFGTQFQSFDVGIKALRNAVTGRYLGRVAVIEDEPSPQFSLAADPNPVTEGNDLVIRGTLSFPVEAYLFYEVQFLARDGFAFLDTDDLDEQFLLDYFGFVPSPALPLDVIFGFMEIPPGATEGSFVLPLRADGAVEGPEGFVARVPDFDNPTLDGDQTVEVTVDDAP
jgi:hypothetical protein